MYNLFTVGAVDWSRLKKALSGQFAVPVEAVEVADANEFDSRNWEAWVSCEYEAVHGDVTYSLNIYATDDVEGRPTERALSIGLVGELQQSLLFPADEDLPSAYWVAIPGGPVTRARLVSSDEEESTYRVDVVEHAVPQLPHVSVAHIPEVIRLVRMATPIADEFKSVLADFAERSPVPDGDQAMEDWNWYAPRRLAAWESLTVRMASHWPPSRWYPADYYRQDLEMRDHLERVPSTVPASVASPLRKALVRIDDAFRKCTEEDGGEALSAALGSPVPSQGWWWHRCPLQIPWG